MASTSKKYHQKASNILRILDLDKNDTLLLINYIEGSKWNAFLSFIETTKFSYTDSFIEIIQKIQNASLLAMEAHINWDGDKDYKEEYAQIMSWNQVIRFYKTLKSPEYQNRKVISHRKNQQLITGLNSADSNRLTGLLDSAFWLVVSDTARTQSLTKTQVLTNATQYDIYSYAIESLFNNIDDYIDDFNNPDAILDLDDIYYENPVFTDGKSFMEERAVKDLVNNHIERIKLHGFTSDEEIETEEIAGETLDDPISRVKEFNLKEAFKSSNSDGISNRLRILLMGIPKADGTSYDFKEAHDYILASLVNVPAEHILSGDKVFENLAKKNPYYSNLVLYLKDDLKIYEDSDLNVQQESFKNISEFIKHFSTNTSYTDIYEVIFDILEYKPYKHLFPEIIKEEITSHSFELDKDNPEFYKAVELVQNTRQFIYLTGKAGAGKTTFLKHIKSITNKNTVVVAPTGVAAINAGGVTIHSFFQLPFRPFLPDDEALSQKEIYNTFQYRKAQLEVIQSMDLLIIDEVSMVRCDTLDVIDRILRVFRGQNSIPFGGVQVILIGDAYQLPPVVTQDGWDILGQFYQTPFFFGAKVVENNPPVYIELQKIYRQKDIQFIELLNRVRENKVLNYDYTVLNSKYNPSFSASDGYITLTSHNKFADKVNQQKLAELPTTSYFFGAKREGDFPEKNYPTHERLELKKGAQVMFIKNDIDKRYYNGTIAEITEINDKKIKVILNDGTPVLVEKEMWENVKYTLHKSKSRVIEEAIGTFEQYPIKLAWAVTVHKSQGMTFEKVYADLENAFASGQVYVALSRCTSFEGLVLKSRLHPNAITTSPQVIQFAQNKASLNRIEEKLIEGKDDIQADKFYQKAHDNFITGKLRSAIEDFQNAVRLRSEIHTEEFKRYILIQGRKLFNYKSKFYKIAEKLNIQTVKTQQLENTCQELTRNNQNFKILVNKKEEVIKLQKMTIKKQNEELNKEKLKNEHLQSQCTKLENQIHNLEQEVRLLRRELRKVNAVKSEQVNEIQQLKKLTWFDKLVGKK